MKMWQGRNTKNSKEAEHHIVSVERCGFFVHPQETWLGASPDGVVIDYCCTLRDYWK